MPAVILRGVLFLKKIFLLIFCICLFSPTLVSANSIDDLNQIFQIIKLGEPLPDVNYIYLPQKDIYGNNVYEGHLNNLDLNINTTPDDSGNDIVMSFWVSEKNGDGSNWLNPIINYFGKPTKKKIYPNKCMSIYSGEYQNSFWMLFSPDSDYNPHAVVTSLKKAAPI